MHREIARVQALPGGAVLYHLRRTATTTVRDYRREGTFKAERLGEVVAAWFAAADASDTADRLADSADAADAGRTRVLRAMR